MTISQIESGLEEWAAGWSAQDAERVAGLFTEDCIYEDVTMDVVNRGRDELRAFANAVFEAIPDFTIDLTSRFVAGCWAGMEWTMIGTHAGDLPGIPATGRRFSVRGSTILELAPDLFARCSDYWDMATFLKQVGRDGDRSSRALPKVIFVLQRRPDLTREQCLEYWSGPHHTSIVERIPGLTRWRQNHVASAPGEPVCDGVGELWFESDEALSTALNSPEMAAAVDDARSFLDMERTGLLIVEEKTIVG